MMNLIIKKIFILYIVALPLFTQAQKVTSTNLKEMEQKAYQGNVNAQLSVAMYYWWKNPMTNETFSKARTFSKMAAEQGNDDAQLVYGITFEMEKNYQNALVWFRKAGEQGNGEALYTIARFYAEGHGVTKDYGKAFEYYMKSAKQGYDLGMLWVGNFYLYGQPEVVDRNVYEAKKWYEKSAELGNTRAMVHLSELYIEGVGIAKNIATAYSWFKKAKDFGDTDCNDDIVTWRKMASEGNTNYKDFINFYDKQQ